MQLFVTMKQFLLNRITNRIYMNSIYIHLAINN